jgi:hypothetical protein
VGKGVYDHTTEEWIVRAYTHRNRRLPAADSFTTDKTDALQTLIAMLNHAQPAGSLVEVDATRRMAWGTPKGGQV